MKTTKNLPGQDRVFSLRYYWHGLPEILYYQIPAKIILFMMVSFAEGILGSVMNLTGIYSVSSGELPSLLRSWYGWVVIKDVQHIVQLVVLVNVNQTVEVHVLVVAKEIAQKAHPEVVPGIM